jgi:signal recognition particle subunit SRP54
VFDTLSDRLSTVFTNLRGKGRLSEADIDATAREIRIALLEADVALPVVREFIARIKERARGEEVSKALNPAQQVIKIVNEEMIEILGGETRRLQFAKQPPTVIMLAGLQGSGKTTSAGKLARLLKTRGRYPLVIAADLQRPAAVEQLVTLGKQVGVPVYSKPGATDPVALSRDGVREAKQTGRDTVIVDTAGRLHIDEELMAQVREVAAAVEPHEVLFVADAMTGQDAVKSAAGFAESLPLTGIILTKTDGDARGGAALSVVSTTGKPIKFVGVGEKPEDFEAFHPDRMASRILGLGDVLTLIEKVESTVDAESARRLAEKTSAGEFTLEDLRDQLASMKKMGPLEGLIDLLPKAGAFKALKQPETVDEKALTRVSAIIDSMTPEERRYPQVLNGSRKKRIAGGSGTSVAEINRLLKQYQQMRRLMRTARKGMRGLDLSRFAMPGGPRGQ